MFKLRTYLLFVLSSGQMASVVSACPFCSVISQTFSEEMTTMDVVVFAKLKSQARTLASNSTNHQEEVGMRLFEITKVVKGEEHLKIGDTFETYHFGDAKEDAEFLAMARDAPNLDWSAPSILTDRAKHFWGELKDLPSGAKRLEFFQDYLEDEDEMLARDAYNEFAMAPYADLIVLKPTMNRQRLIEFLDDLDVPSHRRRLYFTMLGVCGKREDAKLIEKFMCSDDHRSKSGLDAMLACYVKLTGEEGLDKIDELVLKNRDAEYVETYAAIMAIRFHIAETNVVDRKRLAESLRHMLDRPELADLVIADLASLEDWEILPKLCDLFISADDDGSWVRFPVIKYLRDCPLPIAKEKIEELKLIDADAVKHAMLDVSSSASDTSTSRRIQQVKALSLSDSNNAISDELNQAKPIVAEKTLPPWLVATISICFGLIVFVVVRRFS